MERSLTESEEINIHTHNEKNNNNNIEKDNEKEINQNIPSNKRNKYKKIKYTILNEKNNIIK